MAITGSCLCGGIRYQIDGALGAVAHCHCSMCRKATGAAFRTRATVPASSFRWVSGEPDEIGLPLGTLDDDPGVRPSAHVFVGSKAPWFTISDDLPQFADARPDR